MAAAGCGQIRGLERRKDLNGLQAHVISILRGSDNAVRYMCRVPPQRGCPDGRQNVSIRRSNLVFNLRAECRAFANPFDSQMIMQNFRAQALTQVCALRFKYYAVPPTKVDVQLFFGRDVYNIQRQLLQEDDNKRGKGWWNRAGAAQQRNAKKKST